MKKIIRSIVAIGVLLSACSGTPTENINANSGATSSAASMPSEPSSIEAQATNAPLHFFGQMSFGNGTGAPSANGFYYLQEQKNNYANIMYIDYATATYLPLCSRPECKHEDETCTSYLGWRGSYPELLVNDKNLILVYGNGGEQYRQSLQNEALPHIQIADLNGENRTTIATLNANENIETQAVCDDRYVYILKTSVTEAAASTTLCSVSLLTGETKELYSLPNGTSFLMGADGRHVVVKCYSQPEDGSFYSDEDTQSFFCINVDDGTCVNEKSLPFLRNDSAAQTLIYGTTLYHYSPDENMLAVEDLSTGTVTAQLPDIFAQKPIRGQIAAVFQNRVIFEEIFHEDGNASYSWFDLSTKETGSCALKGSYGGSSGKSFPIIPSCVAGENFLAAYQFTSEIGFIVAGDGQTYEIEVQQKNFALIPPDDYFAERENFTPFSPAGG